MKIKVTRTSKTDPTLPRWYPGWLHERYGDHQVQISVLTTLKLKSAVKDCSRALRKRCDACGAVYETADFVQNCESCGGSHVVGFVPDDIEDMTKKFAMPPQGVSDHHFVVGYKTDEGDWIKGSSEPGHGGTDQTLLTYIERYPKDWEVVKKSLGLGRQLGRHACLPAGEGVMVVGGGRVPVPIEKCDGLDVYTGGARTSSRGYSPHGTARLINQGVREVVEYSLSNGQKIRCTKDHLVKTFDGRWVEIQEAMDQQIDLAHTYVRIKRTKSDAEAYAEAKGGTLEKWTGSGEVSTWKCSNGHVWTGSFERLLANEHWCKRCSYVSRFDQTKKKSVTPYRQASKQLSTYRRHDRQHGRDTTVDVEAIITARNASCVYCGRAATGLERIDNSVGHTVENCLPCCLRCNWMRGRYISHEVMLQVGKLLARIDP
jgi:hypothetical protein